MNHRLVRLLGAAALGLPLVTAGCAGFERHSVGPSDPAAAIPLLMGNWKSSPSGSVSGNSCTNFEWRVTGQSGNSLAGEFSAICLGNVRVSGKASGQMNGGDVTYQVTGEASVPGVASCPFSISGVAHVENDSIRIPYSGTTCIGPVEGEETLHRPAASDPAAPEPPAPPPPPPARPYHVPAGPLTAARAEQVVKATGNEYPGLLGPRGTADESIAASEQLLRRMIWHLQLAGYQAGRQQNPSGAISNDKLTIFIEGGWRAFDVFRNLGAAGQTTEVIFYEVFPAHSVPDGGIAD